MLRGSATTGGTVRVTNSLTMPASGKVKLDMSDYPSSLYYTGMTCPLLIAPLGTGLDPDAFELTLPSGFPALFKAASCTLTVETTEDAEILTWKTRKRFVMTTGDAWSQSAFLPAYASHWEGHSNGDPLDPEGFYYVNRDGIALASPNDNSATVAHFGGYSLLVAELSQPFRLFQSAKIDRFYLRSNVKFSVYFGHSWRPMPISLLQGTLTLIAPATPNYALFYGGNNNSLDIQSEIRGDNGLSLSTHSNSDAYPGNGSPTFILSGTNTSFSGKIRVSNATPPTYMTTLKVSDGRNLGGAMAAFTYDSIELKAGSRLTATASLELAEPTRGLFVNGSGRISVPEATDEMKTCAQLTMAGTLVKEGAGVLALGGPACRFTAAQDATPIAGTNVLEVAGGRIKALSKDAFNGLAIAFASGTGLEVPMQSEVDADTRLYGLCDTAWATPFDLAGCGGKLDVSVRDIAAVPDKVDLAICTVASAAAANLRGQIVFPHIPQHTVTILERDNGDGTVTFLARVQNAIHTMVIVR